MMLLLIISSTTSMFNGHVFSNGQFVTNGMVNQWSFNYSSVLRMKSKLAILSIRKKVLGNEENKI